MEGVVEETLNNREIYSTNLPHRAIAVYMYLRDRADKDGSCYHNKFSHILKLHYCHNSEDK